MKDWKIVTAVGLATALGLGVAGVAQAKMGPGADHQAPSFEEIDANGDGAISPAEIQAMADARFAEQDSNGDGVLSAEELLAAMTVRAEERAQMRIARMITWADQDGDGALSADELPGRDRTMMLAHMDEDGDGQISAEEFENAQDKRGKRGGKGKRGDGKRHGGGRNGG